MGLPTCPPKLARNPKVWRVRRSPKPSMLPRASGAPATAPWLAPIRLPAPRRQRIPHRALMLRPAGTVLLPSSRCWRLRRRGSRSGRWGSMWQAATRWRSLRLPRRQRRLPGMMQLLMLLELPATVRRQSLSMSRETLRLRDLTRLKRRLPRWRTSLPGRPAALATQSRRLLGVRPPWHPAAPARARLSAGPLVDPVVLREVRALAAAPAHPSLATPPPSRSPR